MKMPSISINPSNPNITKHKLNISLLTLRLDNPANLLETSREISQEIVTLCETLKNMQAAMRTLTDGVISQLNPILFELIEVLNYEQDNTKTLVNEYHNLLCAFQEKYITPPAASSGTSSSASSEAPAASIAQLGSLHEVHQNSFEILDTVMKSLQEVEGLELMKNFLSEQLKEIKELTHILQAKKRAEEAKLSQTTHSMFNKPSVVSASPVETTQAAEVAERELREKQREADAERARAREREQERQNHYVPAPVYSYR